MDLDDSYQLREREKIVFVSGCYDIIHAGHIQFFEEARALGTYLIVSFASTDVLYHHKNRRPSLPDDHKLKLISSLNCVDKCVAGTNVEKLGLDFLDIWYKYKPHVLAVTMDDKYADIKKALCTEINAEYVVLPKTPPIGFDPISTSQIIANIKAPDEAPLRVDFGGGWLDVPRFAREGAFIVNCTISPLVSLRDWRYNRSSGLGGSGAFALLSGKDAYKSEVDELGVGWQDPAVIAETGLCVWRSGKRPSLALKTDGSFLGGKLAIYWTGLTHDTPGAANLARDYDLIEAAGKKAAESVRAEDLNGMAEAVRLSYESQLKEGMTVLPASKHALAFKYCGGGHGGYGVYLCQSREARDALVKSSEDFSVVEPYIRGR